MKKIVWLSVVLFSAVACDNDGKVASRADSLRQAPDTGAERTADSAKAEKTLDAIKEKVHAMGNPIDSVRKDSVFK